MWTIKFTMQHVVVHMVEKQVFFWPNGHIIRYFVAFGEGLVFCAITYFFKLFCLFVCLFKQLLSLSRTSRDNKKFPFSNIVVYFIH